MENPKKMVFSLKHGLFAAVFFCWVVPIVLIVTLSGALLNLNYKNQLKQTVCDGISRGMEQLQLQIEAVIQMSKDVSYDRDIREAYREYQKTDDYVRLYSRSQEYLSRKFARDSKFEAVYLSFFEEENQDCAYIISKNKNSYAEMHNYRIKVKPAALDFAAEESTDTVFSVIDGKLYLMRSLMTPAFQPYAVLTLQCSSETIFQSLEAISAFTDSQICIDGITLVLSGESGKNDRNSKNILTPYTIETENHTLTFTAQAIRQSIWEAMPGLLWAVLLLLLLVIPLLGAIIAFFTRYVSKPLDTLIKAADFVQSGRRGYIIEQLPDSREFRDLTLHFNDMSTELKSQFDRLYLEQQTLQEAKIKALQSQINPHFLGNTLEVINWEARLARNEKISGMIEALSTMLSAATDRDGRAKVALREDISYADAYLCIIGRRMGGSLKIIREIDAALLDCPVPKLMFQPLAENAVEHDIFKSQSGTLILRAYKYENKMFLEVEHKGEMTNADRENIGLILSDSGCEKLRGGQVGLRNLNQRIKLLYGENGSLSIKETSGGTILAQVCLPVIQ